MNWNIFQMSKYKRFMSEREQFFKDIEVLSIRVESAISMVHELVPNFRASVGPSLFAELETKSLEINIWSDYHQPSTIAALSAPGMINCSRWPGLSLNSVVKPHRISFSPRLADEVERREGTAGRRVVSWDSPPIEGLNGKSRKNVDQWSTHAPMCSSHPGHSSVCGKRAFSVSLPTGQDERKKK